MWHICCFLTVQRKVPRTKALGTVKTKQNHLVENCIRNNNILVHNNMFIMMTIVSFIELKIAKSEIMPLECCSQSTFLAVFSGNDQSQICCFTRYQSVAIRDVYQW